MPEALRGNSGLVYGFVLIRPGQRIQLDEHQPQKHFGGTQKSQGIAKGTRAKSQEIVRRPVYSREKKTYKDIGT